MRGLNRLLQQAYAALIITGLIVMWAVSEVCRDLRWRWSR